jgi:hypothetical protein
MLSQPDVVTATMMRWLGELSGAPAAGKLARLCPMARPRRRNSPRVVRPASGWITASVKELLPAGAVASARVDAEALVACWYVSGTFGITPA